MFLRDFGLPVSDGAEQKLAQFCDFLLQNNRKFNLTSICDIEEVYIKHFYDSIKPEGLFSRGAKVVEIGSGGGFPSIPLKIVREDLDFTLIESTGKKCVYLESCADNLALNGVKVLNIRAEEGARREELREKFDCACARAVARLNTLCEYCLPYVKVGGTFIAYKGSDETEIEECKSAVKILGAQIEKIERYSLPFDMGARTAVVIKKIMPTPAKYPRGRGLERKKPL